ncbi:FAD/NAD(P)-binding oxidoreductase [Algivirga pacifica]|uniref:FAD-dependent oxidoreductase n=1 Tax=Algivirga pacifica TaxID=1162670 RepID=A0ABP9DE55_9BACT
MHIVIIGNGISGITAARYLRKYSKHSITVISSESKYFFSRTALMYIYMGHMNFEQTQPYENDFWEKNNIQLVHDYVKQVVPQQKALFLQDQETPIHYDKLIIATGSKPKYAPWKGKELKGVQGLYSHQDLIQMEKASHQLKHAVITGGGLIGIEMAEMFRSRNISVSLLVRDAHYWGSVLPPEEARIIEKEIRRHHIDLQLSTELKSIQGNPQQEVISITTNHNKTINCGFVGVTIGVTPNIDFLQDSGIALDKGILVNTYFETNQEDIYAIGDCAQFTEPIDGRKPIEQVWYTGRMHGETLAYSLIHKKTAYTPGPWFNSAKFFDIEYQTYGKVSPAPLENEESIYWESSDAKKCIRIAYERDTLKLLGINLLGIRYRHELCHQWIKQGASLPEILPQLEKANFDPEFSSKHENEVIALFQEKFPHIPLKKKKRFAFWK